MQMARQGVVAAQRLQQRDCAESAIIEMQSVGPHATAPVDAVN